MKAMWIAAGILAATALQAGQPQAPPPSRPQIEVTGQITRVAGGFGQGMPSLEVKTKEGRTWRVWLGSMRYLMEHNFNPKAGQEVTVKGFKLAGGQWPGCCGMRPQTGDDSIADQVVAGSVTIAGTKQTIRLRDESGMPLWGGPMRGGRGRGMQ